MGLGNKPQAKEHFLHALVIYRKLFGDDHVNVAICLNNLGIVERDLGNKPQAKEHFLHALVIYRKLLGDDHVRVADCLSILESLEEVES